MGGIQAPGVWFWLHLEAPTGFFYFVYRASPLASSSGGLTFGSQSPKVTIEMNMTHEISKDMLSKVFFAALAYFLTIGWLHSGNAAIEYFQLSDYELYAIELKDGLVTAALVAALGFMSNVWIAGAFAGGVVGWLIA
jgi:hypothetical protein